MPIRIFHLFLAFLAFYFLWGATVDLFNGYPLINKYSFDIQQLIVKITSLVSFFLYPLAVCLILSKYTPRHWGLVLFLIVLSIPLIIFFRYLLQEVIGPLVWGFSVYYSPYTVQFYFRDNMYFAVLYSCFGFIYFIIQYTQYSIKRQAELSVAAKDAELSLLKSQVNPHFLFNSLNSIYTLVYRKDENALQAVEKLSSLLRYALYEHKDKVTLETEIAFLQNYIELQRLRMDKSANILVALDDIDGTLMIIPHLLISFSENAFKHGDLTDPKHPLTITARVEKETLFYHVLNKKTKFNKSLEAGIGLLNVKRRLELLYPDKYELTVLDTDDLFSIDLSIKL